jgi:hypothetical protein
MPGNHYRLHKDIAEFRKLLPELLKEHRARWALISREELLGTFEGREDAYLAGWTKAGRDDHRRDDDRTRPFLVEEITEAAAPTAESQAVAALASLRTTKRQLHDWAGSDAFAEGLRRTEERVRQGRAERGEDVDRPVTMQDVRLEDARREAGASDSPAPLTASATSQKR